MKKVIDEIVTDEVIETYQRDGAVFLPQVISEPWLDLISIGIERNLRSPGPFGQDYKSGGDGRFFMDFRNFAVNPEYQRVLYDSPIVDILAAVMECDEVWLYYEQLFYKGGGRAGRTAWHQDMSYYQMQMNMQISGAWITLDPLPKEASLEYVRGSHLGPLYNTFNKEDPTKIGVDVGAPPLPDVQGNRADYDIVSHPITPGDMLVIHPQILHGGAPNPSGLQRRTFTVNVFGPEVRFERRPTDLGMRYPGLAEMLQPGDLLRHPHFPQLRPVPEWQRQSAPAAAASA